MTQRSARYRRPGLGIILAVGLVTIMARNPAVAEPIDTCGLSPANAGTDGLAAQTATVTRVTGPNSVMTATGQEIRLASVMTPHRITLDPTTVDTKSSAADPMSETGDPDEMPEPDTTEAPASDPIAAAGSALSAWLIGQEIRLYPVTSKPDRYGRTRAGVVRLSDGLWIEAEMVARGLVRVQPQIDDFGCARHLETIEAMARAAKRGLWALPEFAVVEAGDTTRDRWIGRYILIEGEVVSLGTSGTRRYLNFGRNFSRDFAIVLIDKGATTARAREKRPPSRFQQEGFDAPTVVGKRVRVRGILTKGGGGLIVPSVPEEIEWVEDQH